jgi:hypothetical protein
MSDLVIGLGIFLLILGGSLIGLGYFLGKKIPPLHVMLYFMAMFAFLIGILILVYPDSFEQIFN